MTKRFSDWSVEALVQYIERLEKEHAQALKAKEVATTEWVRVHEDSYLFIEVLNLGALYLLRTYTWDSDKDEMINPTVIELDHQVGVMLLRRKQ